MKKEMKIGKIKTVSLSFTFKVTETNFSDILEVLRGRLAARIGQEVTITIANKK